MKLLATSVLAVASPRGENAPLDLGSAAGTHAAGGGSLGRTIVGLAVVLAVIYGLYWALKQVKASREGGSVGGGLSAMATLPLGSNRSLHVVRAGREVLVVGSGEQGVTPVRSYSEAEARDLGLLDDTVEGSAVEVPRRPELEAGRRALDALRAWTVRG